MPVEKSKVAVQSVEEVTISWGELQIHGLNGREPSADDRVLKQKGPLPITTLRQALPLLETLIAGGSRRNRDYCAWVKACRHGQ